MESKEAWKITGDLHVEHGKGDPFAAAIRATRMPMIITDPRRPDNPIIFANDAFLELSGYAREEVTGRNCRFLQGPQTSQKAIAEMRAAIVEGRDIKIDILNYKKDGATFWNALYISPVYNEQGELLYFFASQLDITERVALQRRIEAEKDRFESEVQRRTSELQVANEELKTAFQSQALLLNEVDHRVKNNLQMISSLIVMQSRTISDAQIRASLMSMLARVEALSAVHRRLYQTSDVSRFDLSEFSRDLARDLVSASTRSNVRLEFNLEPIEVSPERAAPIALMLNELVTNSLKHAFVDNRPGKIALSVTRIDGHATITVEDDGIGMAMHNDGKPHGDGHSDGRDHTDGHGDGHRDGSNRADGDGRTASFGKSLVEALGRQVRATTRWEPANPGTRVRISWPISKTRPQ